MLSERYSKLFGCNIHGSIRVCPMALKIIDTPEFQRMREIKQLGLCHLVYPSAVHTRFEHSIGVYHLTGQILDKLVLNYPDKIFDVPYLGQTKLTPIIKECIKIGGLCHDIGHGPFSHIFDDILLNDSTHPNKYHETRSCLITELLCKRELCNELTDAHIKFITAIINPSSEHTGALFQIVSNQLNGIDVDKFDYLIRDSKNLEIGNKFQYTRLINELIIDTSGNICYPKHSSLDILDMFNARYMMHKKVYSHKTVKLIESMLSEIFKRIDNVFNITGTINDMNEFCKLTDQSIFNLLNMIKNPPKYISFNVGSQKNMNDIKIAQSIYDDILTRNLYKQICCVPETQINVIHDFQNLFATYNPDFDMANFCIVKTQMGFVSGNKPNPFRSIYFYDKKENTTSFIMSGEEISSIFSGNFKEVFFNLILKDR